MSGDSPGHKPEAPPGQNPSVEVRRTKTWEVITLLVLGVVVLGLVAGFYVINPAPSPSQYSTFKTLLALAVAGVGALLPGFITLEIGLPKGALRAGGAIALFAIVYFFNPAQLAPVPEQIGGDHIPQTVAAGSTAVIHTGSGKLEIGYTIAQHEQALREREQQMRQDLERAHRAEKKLERITLENELNAVQEQLQNLHNSYQDRIRLLEEAKQQLQALATGLSPEKLQAAKAALAQGDTTLADHLFAEVEALEQTGIERAAAAAYQRGKIAEDRIDYPTAYRHFQRAVQLAPDQLDYVEAAARLAYEMQDLHPAIRWYEQLLASRLKTDGDEHPSVATTRNNLGTAWHDLGELDKAIEYYEQALASFQKAYGDNHPEVVAGTRHNLGTAWQAQGEYAKAIDYYEQALASRLKTYGDEHPRTKTAAENLAAARAAWSTAPMTPRNPTGE